MKKKCIHTQKMKIGLKFSGKVMNSKNFNWSILHSLGGPFAAWNKNPTKSKSLRYLCGESGRLKSLGSQDAFSCKSRICRSAMKSACEAHISIPPKTTTFCFGEHASAFCVSLHIQITNIRSNHISAFNWKMVFPGLTGVAVLCIEGS